MKPVFSIAAVVVVIAALNPRIAFDAGRPLYEISCSTGLPDQWVRMAAGFGLFGA